MGIEFLLYLQAFRERTGGIFDAFFEGVSDFVIGSWIFLVIAFIYWCVDKKAGTMIMMNIGVGNLVMQFCKNLFCVYRPWVRDARIIPAGDSIATATGYSFPSGHTQIATSEFGSFALWQKKRKWFVALCIIIIAFVAFSRNYLGVHTPQDVIVGAGLTVAVIFANKKLFEWIDKNEKRDILVFAISIVTVIGYLLFISCKTYPVDYAQDGRILTEPADMIAEGYAAASCFVGFFIGWIVERRFIRFETPKRLKHKIIMFLIGAPVLMAILLLVCEPLYEMLKSSGIVGWCIGKLLFYVILYVFVMILYPLFIKFCTKKFNI